VDSTKEVEYITAANATKEDVWMKKLFIELGVVPSAWGLMETYCDNKWCHNSGQGTKVSLQEQIFTTPIPPHAPVRADDIKMRKIHTVLNVSNPLIKPMTLAKT
jgi:hypothetical protein